MLKLNHGVLINPGLMMKKLKLVFILLIALILGFSLGYFYFNQTSNISCESNYEYINTRIGCQPKPVISKHEYTGLVQELNAYIAEETKVKHVSLVSVYYRDLSTGPTFGIESQQKFAPASLLKVPLLLTYLSLNENKNELLNKQIAFKGTTELLTQSSSGSSALEANKAYAVDSLLSKMIIDSDNLAYVLLVNYLRELYPKEAPLTETMLELGLVNPRNPSEDTITVKAYASIFRHLYNSSYLSPEMSDKALELLSRADYAKGLVAGVPAGTKVAHKFGERGNLPNNVQQLHDCGIIYYPDNPYLLCIMTRGDDMQELEMVIKAISEKVYKEVDSRRIQ